MSRLRRLMVRVSCLVALASLTSGRRPAQTSDDLFNPDVLQRVELWLNSPDWAKLKAAFQENTYYPGRCDVERQTVRNVGIRSRGLGSRSGTKPGLRVDFDRYSSGQQFLGLKSIVLDNLTQDHTGIKETVAMRFFTRLGIPAPRETHTRLYVNGDYAGLYGLVESVDKTMMGRVFGSIGDNVQNDGYLFEYNYVLGSAVALHVRRTGLWRRTRRGSTSRPTRATPTSAIWGPIEELVRLVNDTSSTTFERDRAEARPRGVCPLHRRPELRRRRTTASTATTG